ncbi:hypothetical protein V493_07974 [Pseudogymnoascus sp. VKM F-4281 (FW-2241)]|nr:hypothetical protein V493_07974 [Pseudogymnoascus sp. VKM F-4281 (FW-2241)]
MVSKLPRNTTLYNARENHRTLVIVLSAVFGSLAIFMIASATVFVIRWRRNPKYHRRGISPVDDEEIERWRGRKETYTEAPAQSPPKSHRRQSSSVVIVSHPPGWTWSAEPSPFGSRNSGETALSPPPMVARAPNSRSGLTDGAILGADPFVPPVRRPSARLAKHGRNQSRKSSFSASIPERMSTDHSRHYRDDSKKSFQAEHVSPPSSIFNGSPGGNEPLPTFTRPTWKAEESHSTLFEIPLRCPLTRVTTVLVPTSPGAQGILPVYAHRAQIRSKWTSSKVLSSPSPTSPPKPAADKVPRLPRRPLDPLLPPLARPLPNPPPPQLGARDAPPPRAPAPPPTQQPRARLPRHRVSGRAPRYLVPLDARHGVYAEDGCVWSTTYLRAGVLWRDCGGGHDGVSEGRGEDGE